MNPGRGWHKARRRLAGLVLLAALGGLVVLSVALFNKDFTQVTIVTLYTDSTGNEMNLNADVMVRGVIVGEVRSITSDGSGARLGLAIDPSAARALPANVTAQMLPTTLFGQRYVELVEPATPSALSLADSRAISQDRSADAIEVEKVLNDLEPMLTAVQPEKLSATLSALAAALQGRGPELGQTLVQLDAYLRQLNPRLPALDADIRELIQVTSTYSRAAPSLVQALRDFSVTSQTIASEASNLDSLFSTVTAASQNLSTFLQNNQQVIISLAATSQTTLQTLARYSAEFPCISQGLSDFVPNSDRVLGAGTGQPGLHITVHPVQSMGSYRPGADTPRYGDDLGPHCYTVPFGGIQLNDGTSQASSTPATATARTVPAAGLGLPNSPQENELINEIVSPELNVAPSRLPSWSSVLLGPVYRGTTVGVR
ncbi:MAG: MCE family protein [Streptosporangiaceae bacterium]|nr:MCE family protein [Streptosporangiaceae bacterium]